MENSIAPPPQPDWLPPQAPVSPVAPKPVAVAAHNEAFGAKHKRAGSGILAGLIALAAKGKALLLLLPKIKLLTTGASALVSVAAYALFWGWTFAIGFVVLLFVHEMGHVVQLRREGIQASAPMFIPFFGAVVMAKSLGDDAVTEARVGLAGPIFGTAAAGVCLVIAELTNSNFWRALAYVGFLLNLFNLLPVTPLDGGRAMAALSPVMWFVGLGLMGVLAFTFSSPLIFLFLVIAGFDVYRRWTALRKGGEAVQSFYRVSARNRVLVAAVYLGLVAVLVVGMDVSYVARTIH
jgi:Zn-dependent protease